MTKEKQQYAEKDNLSEEREISGLVAGDKRHMKMLGLS